MTDVAKMDHKTAAGTLRRLEYRNEGDEVERFALALRALKTSPPQWAHVWAKRVALYASGRTVKVLTADIASLDGVPTALVDEIDAVEREMERNEGEQS